VDLKYDEMQADSARHHSGLMLAAWMTLRHFSVKIDDEFREVGLRAHKRIEREVSELRIEHRIGDKPRPMSGTKRTLTPCPAMSAFGRTLLPGSVSGGKHE
jgi:hypothetical protein